MLKTMLGAYLESGGMISTTRQSGLRKIESPFLASFLLALHNALRLSQMVNITLIICHIVDTCLGKCLQTSFCCLIEMGLDRDVG